MRVAVTVDDREPKGIAAAVRRHPDVESVTVRRLPAGDFEIGEVGVERKTLRDYVNGVMGRTGPDLYEQVARMTRRYERSYVLLEGNLSDVSELRTSVSVESVAGSIASVLARYDVPVVPCSDRERLVDLAVRIGRKRLEEPSVRALPPGAVPSRNEPIAKRMYGCIEGIGPGLAAALYEAYPSVEALLDASPAELRRIDGVGEVRARAVYEAFRTEE